MPEISLPSFPFTPQLGWSTTRSETFRTCRRRYFYQYYGKFDPEIPLERILQLKGLSSIPMTVGTAVHDVLATLLQRLLRTAAPIDRERFCQYTSARTLNATSLWRRTPSRSPRTWVPAATASSANSATAWMADWAVKVL